MNSIWRYDPLFLNGSHRSPLVIIHNLNLVGRTTTPCEAHPVFVVNPNAVLAQSVSLQSFQTIASRHKKFVQVFGSIEIRKLPDRNFPNLSSNLPAPAGFEQFLSPRVLETRDHSRREGNAPH